MDFLRTRLARDLIPEDPLMKCRVDLIPPRVPWDWPPESSTTQPQPPSYSTSWNSVLMDGQGTNPREGAYFTHDPVPAILCSLSERWEDHMLVKHAYGPTITSDDLPNGPQSIGDKIGIFEDRLRGWKLDIAKEAIERNGHAGFAVLDI